jgi:hypothetical protein
MEKLLDIDVPPSAMNVVADLSNPTECETAFSTIIEPFDCGIILPATNQTLG